MIELFLAAIVALPKGVPVTTQYWTPPVVEASAPDLMKDPPALPLPKYRGVTAAIVATMEDVNKHPQCKAQKGWQTRACTFLDKNIILMPNPCNYPNDGYARLFCHELGHVNGWRHPELGPEYEEYVKKHGLKPTASNPSPISRSPSQDIQHE